jgi:hypothetical protein
MLAYITMISDVECLRRRLCERWCHVDDRIVCTQAAVPVLVTNVCLTTACCSCNTVYPTTGYHEGAQVAYLWSDG